MAFLLSNGGGGGGGEVGYVKTDFRPIENVVLVQVGRHNQTHGTDFWPTGFFFT